MTGKVEQDFTCLRCGQCCREPGYVHLTESDVYSIADYLDLTVDAFVQNYTRLGAHRRKLSLNENEDASCIFLNDRQQCDIEVVKPRQCRDFPYAWRYARMTMVCEGWRKRRQRQCGGDDAERTT